MIADFSLDTALFMTFPGICEDCFKAIMFLKTVESLCGLSISTADNLGYDCLGVVEPSFGWNTPDVSEDSIHTL